MGKFFRPTLSLSAVLAIVYWLTLPPNSLVLDESCQVPEIRLQLSEILYGKSFWEAQKAALAEAVRVEFSLRAASERGHDSDESERSSIEQKMTRLSDRDQGGDQQAAALIQRKRIARLGWLNRCQQVIEQNLR